MARSKPCVTMSMTPEEKYKFKALGGTAWVLKMMALEELPTTRPNYTIDEKERIIIGQTKGRVKAVMKAHNVNEEFVWMMRKKHRL